MLKFLKFGIPSSRQFQPSYPIYSFSTISKFEAFKILGLKSNATRQDVKKAYFNKAKIHHPDTGNVKDDGAMFKKV